MVVNPAYKGIRLPVDQWPLLSTYRVRRPSTTRPPRTTACATTPEPFYSADRCPPRQPRGRQSGDAVRGTQLDGRVCLQRRTGQSNSMVAGIGKRPAATSCSGSRRWPTTSGTTCRRPHWRRRAGTSSRRATVAGGGGVTAQARQHNRDVADSLQHIPDLGRGPGLSRHDGRLRGGADEWVAANRCRRLRLVARVRRSTGQTPGSGVGQLPPGYLPTDPG